MIPFIPENFTQFKKRVTLFTGLTMKFASHIKSQFNTFNQHVGAKYTQYDPHDFANNYEVVFAQRPDYFIAMRKSQIG